MVLEVFANAVLSTLLRLSLPTAVAWLFARFVLDVSLQYLLSSLWLELVLRVRRAGAAAPAAAAEAPALSEEARSQPLRGVAVQGKAEYCKKAQTLPPTKRVSSLFPRDALPAGEVLAYAAAAAPRRSSLLVPFLGGRAKEAASEGPAEDEAWQHRLACLREGAEVHRQVRQYVQQRLRPGLEHAEVVEMVEKASSSLVGFDAKQPLKRGWAFPTGLSLNEIAAHDTVNPGDAHKWLQPSDLGKLDFGVHVDGHILDCAFSFAFDSMHDELMQAVKDATNEGIRLAGPDALVSEVGAGIREVMESSEVHRPDGKVVPIYAIKNLTGHSIEPYKIHAGKSLPSVRTGGRVRMLPGELWAVETFGSAGGVGYVVNAGPSSHFMRPSSAPPPKMLLSQNAQAMLELIDRRFGTLAFCPRWILQEASRTRTPLQKGSPKWWEAPLQELCNFGVVHSYPPLADLPGCYTAQYEHTVLLRSSGKEVLTRGCDY